MIKLSMMLLSMTVTMNMASASAFRIGNGDDGTDLEGTVKISSGPIFESRAKAVANLKVLNVQGVEGLGTLIPELEHSDLLLATIDVQALSSEGSWEASGDRKKVYARTFAEAHAPTRFFPAALSLNQDQLIALHTHEALHRALPEGIREDEERVAIMTMAITSPSATFDRVNMVAHNVLRMDSSPPATSFATVSTSTRILGPEPKPMKSKVTATHSSYSNPPGGYGFANVEKLTAEFSPLGTVTVWKRYVEPRFAVEGTMINDPTEMGVRGGPVSGIAKLPFSSDSGTTAGPLVRLSVKSLEETGSSHWMPERDVYSIGGFVEVNHPYEVRELILTYTLPSTTEAGIANEFESASSTKIGSIWSLNFRDAYKWKRFQLGGLGEFHHARAAYRQAEPITIVRAGPEVRYISGRFSFGVSGLMMLNQRSQGRLDDLADISGHGSGKNSASASLAVEI